MNNKKNLKSLIFKSNQKQKEIQREEEVFIDVLLMHTKGKNLILKI